MMLLCIHENVQPVEGWDKGGQPLQLHLIIKSHNQLHSEDKVFIAQPVSSKHSTNMVMAACRGLEDMGWVMATMLKAEINGH